MRPVPDKGKEPVSHSRVPTILERGLLFFLVWLVLMPSVKLADLVVGVIAAVLATWTSLRLLPPEAGYLRFGALLAFVPHFMWQSVLAGVDVARRAFDPRLPLRPGFVVCRVGFPPGPARNEFAVITSLLPGSVPAGDVEGAIIYHALDTRQPVAEQLAEEEKRLTAALIGGDGHD
ncbi:Na+/H+ antiporter subunit E [Dyella halodurans]|uniref:Na+/H+ antiporter subunit E n=1 Tax=Dyella halodurans TaxID=1920171 RepID=A0ABV9C201_9GAMM|nr:Na+/H+ antiporter subunit E [Dyella halodurans]